MRLQEFSVENYRSLTRASSLSLQDLTVLIGQNNEGKSNILSALVTAMQVIKMMAPNPLRYRERLQFARLYNWDRDYPLREQSKAKPGPTIFRLTFQLESTELSHFYNVTGSRLNGTLPIEILVHSNLEPELRVVKSGRGARALTKQSGKICKFIGDRIDVNYIPAVRTADESLQVIRRMLTRELAILDENPEYQDALRKIAELQDPILAAISAEITSSLRGFLPQVKSAEVRTSARERSAAMSRSVSVIIDDGSATSIEQKGDGIKSLAAISLLQTSGERRGIASILAIEEPESHLHASAIHRLQDVLKQVSHDRQVVITTHSAALVDRLHVANNVIVSKNRARPAKSLAQIRDILGVRASIILRMHRWYWLWKDPKTKLLCKAY